MVKWLFERGTQEELLASLTYACDQIGCEYRLIDYTPFELKEKVLSLYGPDECVVTLGSIQLCNFLSRNAKWVPGIYCTFSNYECTNYYPILSKYILNDNYVMLPFGELKRRKEFLFSTLGQDRCVFVRPNVGTKTFTGKVCKEENFEAEVDFFGFYDTKASDLVVVATPRNILTEWRMLVVGGKVVTGSRYLPDRNREVPQTVVDYANEVAKVYQPDGCFVVDVGETKTGLYVVEIGSFSCAGMYLSDPMIIIKSVSEQAYKDWQDVR